MDDYESDYGSRSPTAAIDEAPLIALAAGVAAGALVAALLPVTRQERKFAKPVSLAAVKAEPALSEIELLRQSRLSVAEIRPEEWEIVSRMGEG